jgi:type IV pilus assembly protein PilB
MTSSLITLIQRNNLLSYDQLHRLNAHIDQSDESIFALLSKLECPIHQPLATLIARELELKLVELKSFHYRAVIETLNLHQLSLHHQAIPILLAENTLQVAVADDSRVSVLEDFRFASGFNTELVIANWLDIQQALHTLSESTATSSAVRNQVNDRTLEYLVELDQDERHQSEDLSQDDAPISQFIHQVLLEAIQRHASDIHFEPYETHYRIRMRCDGMLIVTHTPSRQLSRRLAARIKILANLDIAERRLAQDGRITLALNVIKTADTIKAVENTNSIDLRVSTLPTLWGEKIVLRLLDTRHLSLNIDQLGMNQAQAALYSHAIKQSQGMILVTGPTGSGKTVSLYAALNQINHDNINISTVEDPVEITLNGVNQVPLNDKIGFTFSDILKTFLRQDPDVIMVGEIRDLDTASVAFKAAQTGHLVLSTLHTNSAADSAMRLLQIGVEPFLVSAAVRLIIAQRLLRKLCPKCKQPLTLTTEQYDDYGISQQTQLYQPLTQGCRECTAGYKGRIGVYELLYFTPEIAQAVNQRVSKNELLTLAKSQGMKDLWQSGITQVIKGVTSLSELLRVIER